VPLEWPSEPPSRSAFGWVIGTVVLTVALLVFVAQAAALPGHVSRSQYTQAHGVREQAIFAHSIYSGTNTETWADVTLTRRVNGRTTSVVHVPGEVTYTPGQHLTVVVDPKQASYSEIAGNPAFSYSRFLSEHVWIGIPTVIAIVILVMLVGESLWRVCQWLRRRWTGTGPPAEPL
jgi:hypothetical protein